MNLNGRKNFGQTTTIFFVAVVIFGFTAQAEVLDVFRGDRESKEFRISVGKAIVPETDISAIAGHPTNISCRSENEASLRMCRWERLDRISPNERYIINVVPNGSNGTFSNGSYSYVGQGLNNGDCTISINNVTEFHNAAWECFLIGTDEFTWIGKLSVHTFGSITSPYINSMTNLTNMVLNDTSSDINVTVECCISGGLPSVPFEFDVFVENTTHNVSRKPYSTLAATNETNTKCKTLRYTFTPDHNGNLFVCKATYDYNLEEHTLSTSVPIQIMYPPRLDNPKNYSQHIENSKNHVVTVEFSSYPMPNITWFGTQPNDDDKDEDIYFQIKNNTKYEVNLYPVKRDKYVATLRILEVNDEDYHHAFKMQISNAYGTREVHVKIVSPAPGDELEAYWLMIIIAGGCVVLLGIIIVVAVCIVKSRRKKYEGYKVATKVVTYSTTVPTQNDNQVSNANENQVTE